MKIHPPYQAGSVSVGEDYSVKNDSDRTVFQYGEEYFRVEEICFPHKPCIVIEYGNDEDLMNDTMIDAEPFPYDLSREEIELEVKYSLGILPYPKH